MIGSLAARSRLAFGAAACIALSACGAAASTHEGAPPADPVDHVRARALYEHGIAFAHAGDYVRAEEYIEAAIGRGYPERRAIPVLMRVCIASSRLREAVSYATPFLSEHPDDWPLRFLVASLELALGDAHRAQDDLQAVVQAAPDAPDPHFMLAVVLRDDLGKPDDARAEFRRYLALAPRGDHAMAARAAIAPHPVPADEAPSRGALGGAASPRASADASSPTTPSSGMSPPGVSPPGVSPSEGPAAPHALHAVPPHAAASVSDGAAPEAP